MYDVQWCDHEGNLNHRTVETLEEARLEYEYLDKEKQYDGVRIMDPNGNEIISY